MSDIGKQNWIYDSKQLDLNCMKKCSEERLEIARTFIVTDQDEMDESAVKET